MLDVHAHVILHGWIAEQDARPVADPACEVENPPPDERRRAEIAVAVLETLKLCRSPVVSRSMVLAVSPWHQNMKHSRPFTHHAAVFSAVA
jgi:hypothetical protein